jgi:hypothetical protein
MVKVRKTGLLVMNINSKTEMKVSSIKMNKREIIKGMEREMVKEMVREMVREMVVKNNMFEYVNILKKINNIFNIWNEHSSN